MKQQFLFTGTTQKKLRRTKLFKSVLLILISLFIVKQSPAQGSHENFKVAIYTRAYEVQKMEDPQWLESTWETISSQLKVDRIYLETHRDLLIVDEKTLESAIKFFNERGIETEGGITYTVDESNQFETFCYTNPEHKAKVQEIIEHTARFFDEIILDDFFFTSCKCELCVKAKGNQSWASYRTKLMTEATKSLILEPAKKINPNAQVIIKYPNWYEHFHELGFDLENEPTLYDGLYTGTETRDAVRSNQHLQPYLGYLVFRYYENLKPGKNLGGWVDTGGMSYYDRYAEQLWLTIFAKAPEMTLFDYRQLLYPLRENWEPEWKNQETSFNYKGFLPINEGETMAKTAAHSLKTVDAVAGELGNPFGIKSYKPYHSTGEDFLQNYLGMIGIPLDLVPYFPMDDEMIILTELAKHDPDIVEKIEQRLLKGNDVIITSGLLNALQDRGIKNIVNLEHTSRKANINSFLIRGNIIESDSEMIIPQIKYFTNDSWEIVSAMDNELGWPLLHQGKYGNATLYLLTIPENFTDLYNLPETVLNNIREIACKPLDIIIEGPSKIAIFMYDNNTFAVESFNSEPVSFNITSKKSNSIQDIINNKKLETEKKDAVIHWGKEYSPEKYMHKVTLQPHSFGVYRIANN
jgi:hypothetical protein